MKRVGLWVIKPRSALTVGALLVGTIALGIVVALQQNAIRASLPGGETVRATFGEQYRLIPSTSKVKIAGLTVGVVTKVEDRSGTALVSMKVDTDAARSLGDGPAAHIRPTTLLGGNYYVDLVPGGKGGYHGETIPAARTSTPVELDAALKIFQQPALTGLKTSVAKLDRTLRRGGQESIGRLLDEAPGALSPASRVIPALRGTRPGTDLGDLVASTATIAEVLTARDGQLGRTIDSLSLVTRTLAETAASLTSAARKLPRSLDSTVKGMRSLDGTLDRTIELAPRLAPSVRELDQLLGTLDPILVRARPVVADLRLVLADARPTVQQLVPAVELADQNVDNVRGPVIDRVAGSVLKSLMSPWRGAGQYAGGGNGDHPAYKEIGYLGARGANISGYADKNGQMLGLALGIGTSTVGGTGLTLDSLVDLAGLIPER